MHQMDSKRTKKKLDGNCTRMLLAILNKSWKQHPKKQLLDGHLPPISKTIQIRRTRYAGHCWRSKDKLISDVLQWTPSQRHASVGRSTRTYLQQLDIDTGCSLEDLPEAMDDWNEGQEKSGKSVLAAWHDDDMCVYKYMCVYIYIYIYICTKCRSKIWNNFKKFFCLICPIFEKNVINLNFHD